MTKCARVSGNGNDRKDGRPEVTAGSDDKKRRPSLITLQKISKKAY
jgi:hypothetical protein